VKKLLSFVILSILLIIPLAPAWAKYDASHLSEPEITVSPTSGPPGTKITITVSNFPDISDEPYPYPDFYVYLSFSKAIGTNVPTQCGGETCFPIYTYEDAQKRLIADKTITFTLFSLSNPKSVYESGMLHSVCDIMVNGKIQQSFGDTCYNKNQPLGDYEIKFAWATKTHPDEPYILKTVTFTVTEGGEAPEPTSENPHDIILKEYELGLISEEEFETKLKELGYDSEAIRQAKSLIGKLPHQIADQDEEQKQSIEEGMEELKEETTESPQPSTPKSGCLIATAAFGSELAPQVQMLRETRDNIVMQTKSGATFMTAFNSAYYSFAPTVADWERQNPVFKEIVKVTITPLIATLSILNYVNIDSEAEMLGYGIGVILLNLGMYFAAPAFVIMKCYKRY